MHNPIFSFLSISEKTFLLPLSYISQILPYLISILPFFPLSYYILETIFFTTFHVIQNLNRAVDRVRKDELQKSRKEGNEELVELINCRQRFILLKSKKNLTENQAEHLKKVYEINRFIYKAMLLKESFLEVYSSDDIKQVGECLNKWIKQARSSCLKPFVELSYKFKEKM
ncbi:transposase, partial [Candidatus Calescamantes bacterium]|nr:transposase [Candidatus Calescamantes bacterium]